MKSITLGRIFSTSLLCLATAGFASPKPVDAPVSMGNNTYSITVEATSAFQRDLDKLKQEVTDAANQFCAGQGKQIRLISLTGKVPMFSTGYARAKIVFQALNPGDPQLAMPVVAPSGSGAAPVVMVMAPPRLTTDELYSELVKLDELRKKGILTDDEFQAEKKKLLDRSN